MFQQLYRLQVCDTFAGDYCWEDDIYTIEEIQKKISALKIEFNGDESLQDFYYMVKRELFRTN